MTETQGKDNNVELLQTVAELVKLINQLSSDAYLIYEPQVNEIILSKCKDINHIERTLDYMLEFCSNEEMLLLYKKLCRYLYFIDPESAIFYVHSYRERWEEE